jgi:hypothetical protein
MRSRVGVEPGGRVLGGPGDLRTVSGGGGGRSSQAAAAGIYLAAPSKAATEATDLPLIEYQLQQEGVKVDILKQVGDVSCVP